MTRRRIALLFLPVALLLALAGAFYWLLHTTPGAHWLWQRAAAATPGELTVTRLRGNLQSGLQLFGISYRDQGVDVHVDRAGLRADIDLWPLAVAVHDLEFNSVDVLTVEVTGTDVGDDSSAAEWLPQLALPIPLEFHSVRGVRLGWQSGEDQSPLQLQDLSLAGSWFRTLELREAAFRAEPGRWRGDARLRLAAPFEAFVSIDADLALVAEDGSSLPLEVAGRLDGDLSELDLEIYVREPELSLTGKLHDVLEQPAWDVQLSAPRLRWPLAAAEPEWLLEDLFAAAYGGVDDYSLEVQGALGIVGVPPLQLRLLGDGDGGRLTFQRLDLAGQGIKIDGGGSLAWEDEPELQAALNIAELNPGHWLADWQEAAPVSGQLQISWRDGRLGLSSKKLASPGTLAHLSGRAGYDAASGAVDTDLSWEGLAWPPGSGSADGPPATVSSENGHATLQGRFDHWSLEGELELSAAEWPSGRLAIRGTGDTESGTFSVPRAEALGGRLSGELELRWAPGLSWSVDAEVENLATGPLAPDFPGRLSGGFSSRGQAHPLQWSVDLRRITGTLRNRAVSAHGGLAFEDGQLWARTLEIRSGASRLGLDGAVKREAGLAVTADIVSLGDFVDGAAGTFSGRGRILLDPSRPSVQLEGRGEGLAWSGGQLDSLSVDRVARPAGAMRIDAEGLELGELRVDHLLAELSSERPLDRLWAEARSAGNILEFELIGAIGDWSEPLQSGWAGELTRLRLETDEMGVVSLEQPAPLRLDPETALLDSACLRGSPGGRLCLEMAWQAANELRLELDLERVSPNLAMSLLGSELSFSQRISGTVDWRQRPRTRPEALVALAISPGQVSTDDGEIVLISTKEAVFGFRIADGSLYSGNLDIPLVGAGGIDTDFGVPDLSDGLDSPLEGQLRMDLVSIEPVLQLFPGVEGSSGPVTADLRFSGTIADPKLTGHLSLVRGRISHFASGLLLEDLQLAGSVYQVDRAQLNGTFRAGEGRGRIEAVIEFDDLLAPRIALGLSGENLTVVNVPDLQVRADPDLRLDIAAGQLMIDGRIGIPSARLSPRYLPTSSSVVSPDFLIVAGEDPLAEAVAAKPPETRIQGSLELALGGDVTLSLDRAQANIGGTAVFRWTDQLVPVAEGVFTVSGQINAYGQVLRVSEGRVNFAGRPADNPFLNVRAEREIFGNSQVRRAGVLVTGTLKEPILETYTVPMTTRERALTLLVTGNDFDYEQGVGSVEVGMYIAPRLFISYGVGLFERQNVISLRYDLGRGFGIRTTSGQRETGADITYTIER